MDKELKAALDKLAEGIEGKQAETFEEIQKRLLSLEERDTHPGDEKVQDLEKSLKDAEKGISDLTEELRLLRAEWLGIAPPTKDKDADVFKGVFFDDVDGVKESLQGETRNLDVGSFLTTGGTMPAEAMSRFIDFVTDQSATLSAVSTVKMRNNVKQLDELVLTPRQLIADTEATAPAVADAVATSRRTLTALGVIHAENLTLDMLEDNIEGGGAEQHIAEILAKSLSSDLNDLLINGDATTGTFLAINQGLCVLALADAAVTDQALAGAATGQAAFRLCNAAMPAQYQAIGDLGFITNPVHAMTYADELASRTTQLGDDVLVNGFPALRYFGRRVIVDGHMNETQVGVQSDRKVIFTPLSNLVHGVQRSITIEGQWQPRTRVVEYTLTARVDAQHASGAPYVLGDGLIAALRGA